MRSIPVDERAFEGFMVLMSPEERVNLDTGEVRKDRSSGETVWTVGIVAMRGRDSSVEQITVVGEPRGLAVGMQVRVVGLEGTMWALDGRSGVSFRARSIVPMGDPGTSAAGRRAAAATGNPPGPGGPGGPGTGPVGVARSGDAG